MVEDFLDFEGHSLSRPEFAAFVEPSINDEVHSAANLRKYGKMMFFVELLKEKRNRMHAQ